MARFANQEGLNSLGKSVWAETVESGSAIVGQAESGEFGAIESVTVTP